MNMLVIGNGFDLALGLPTKYTDFLKFAEASQIIYNHSNFEAKRKPIDCLGEMRKRIEGCPHDETRIQFIEAEKLLFRFQDAVTHQFALKAFMDFHRCTYENRWIEYFQQRFKAHLIAGENWIDLEDEIKTVIRNLEGDKFEIIERKPQEHELQCAYHGIQKLLGDVAGRKIRGGRYRIPTQVYRNLLHSLRDEFDQFIMALGIYLDFFVRCLDEDYSLSKDIYRLSQDGMIDHVLSFNYINYYNRIYSDQPETEGNTCYVHGAVQYFNELQQCLKKGIPLTEEHVPIEQFIKKNKMIIGFDEYLSSNTDEQLDFVYYRKYFQRISKGTGSQYLNWLDKYKDKLETATIVPELGETREEAIDRMLINEADKKPNYIFVFGHSLDATDKDIFRDIFMREPNDTKVVIFYHDDEAHDRIIVNLIRMLSREVLIKKTHGQNPDIELRHQTE